MAGVGGYDPPIWVLETLGLVRLSLYPYGRRGNDTITSQHFYQQLVRLWAITPNH